MAMKILFVFMGAENLGIEYLAAGARAAGHEVDLAFDPSIFGGHLMMDIPVLSRMLDISRKIVRKIVIDRPDVVAFSCLTANYHWSLSIAKEIKKLCPEIITVFGGAHPTAVPEKVIAEHAVDALIVGEADLSFILFLEALERNRNEQIPGVWRKIDGDILFSKEPINLVSDLDSLPFPAKDIFYSKAPFMARQYSTMGSRGCPFKCTYCFRIFSRNISPDAKAVRYRTVDNLILELELAIKSGKVQIIHFRDDTFVLKKDWLLDFSQKYRKRIGLPFNCNIHPSHIDEETADLLRDSLCSFVDLGIQSVDQNQRSKILKRYYTNDKVKETVVRLKERGIKVFADHIIGIPGDTPEILHEAVAFYNDIRPHRLNTLWLTYFPATEIMNTAREMGHLSDADIERIENAEVGCIISGNGLGRDNPIFRKIRVLMGCIPLLPKSWISFLLRTRAYRWFPGTEWAYSLPTALEALKRRDEFFLYYLRYFVSRKNLP